MVACLVNLKTMKDKVKIFGQAMVNELHANKGKGKWDNLHPLYLCAELHYHASKLYKACDEDDKQKILEHSADCANIAMMIADVTASLNLLNMPRVSNNEVAACDNCIKLQQRIDELEGQLYSLENGTP